MVSLPGWTFSDSCPFCHLFIFFVFLYSFLHLSVCCTLPYCWLLLLLYFALLLVVIAVVLCLLSPVCFFSYFLLVVVRAVRCCSLLLLFFLLRLLWTFRLCLVPVACCRPLFFVFCAHSGFVLYLLFAVVPVCLFFVL